MDLREYLKRLNIEPASRAPDFQAARHASLEHARAAKAADRFEESLHEALKIPVGGDALADRVRAQTMDDAASPRPWRGWLSAAAGVVAAVALAALLWAPAPDPALAATLAAHQHDTSYAAGRTIDPRDVIEAYSRMGVTPSADLGEVSYLSPCMVDGRPGVHMRVRTSRAETAEIIFMSGAHAQHDGAFEAHGRYGELINTPTGTAVVLSERQAVSRSVRDSLLG